MNRVAYLNGTENIEFDELPIPVPKPNEVLVKIEYVGICGSDVHYYQHGRIGDFVIDGKFILGHECSGVVKEVGSLVENLKVGDRVSLEPGMTCGECEFCKSGYYNLCPDVVFFATPPYHGTFCDYVAFPENMCFKLPDNVSTMEGALVEPLSIGFHSAMQGGVKPGDTVVILGAGCIGLVTLLACKAFGASKVIVSDVLDKRLEFAKKLGADYVINAKEIDVVAKIAELTDGRGADVVLEAAGNKEAVRQTPYIARRGGTIVLVGMTPENEISYNFSQVLWKELTIKSVFRFKNLFPTAINSISAGKTEVKSIVTHEFDFYDLKKAFEFVIENSADVVKAVIKL